MRIFKTICIYLLFLGLLITIGCSGHKGPIEPDDPARSGATFLPSWTLFSDFNAVYNEIDWVKVGGPPVQCDIPPPPDWWCMWGCGFFNYPNATYQFIAIEWWTVTFDPEYKVIAPAFDIFEVVVDIE